MRTMKLCALALLVAGGCATKDPCDGKSGVCISAHVDGNAKGLTQLLVTLPDMRQMPTQSTAGAISLPAQFAILIAGTAPASPIKIHIDGLRSGVAVASDERDVTLTGTRGQVSFTLNDPTGGGGSGGGGGGPDMSDPNAVMVTGVDPVTVEELTQLNVDVSATDPLGTAVTVAATSLPGNATFTPNGAAGKLSWKPGFTESGTYTVKVTATPADATRAVTRDLVITVKNYADPILIAGAPQLGAVPIGDWDKDGFGDLAVCTGDAAGATGKYHIKIIYGAATGLPLDAASAAGRVDSFDITAANLGGVNYTCKGGDFDGDGKSDIIFSDPRNDYWKSVDGAAGTQQGKLTVFFGGARGTAPTSIFIVGNENFGGELAGGNYAVGDFTGDGKADIATTWNVAAQTYTLFAGGARANQTTTSNAQDYPSSIYTCGSPISVALVDFDKDGKADWVIQETGLNYTGTEANCGPVHMAAGGLRVIKGRGTAPLLDPATTSTFVDYYAPTTVAAAERYHWAREGVGCDVDNDGYGDLGLLPTWAATTTEHGQVYYGSATGLLATANMPLSDMPTNSFDTGSMQVPHIGCFKDYLGKPALAVSQFAQASGPGEVQLFAGRPLTKVGTLSSPDSADSLFGRAILSGSDVDGDGKQDLVIISSMSGWVIYGR